MRTDGEGVSTSINPPSALVRGLIPGQPQEAPRCPWGLRRRCDIPGLSCDPFVVTKDYAMSCHGIQGTDGMGLDQADPQGHLLAIPMESGNVR